MRPVLAKKDYYLRWQQGEFGNKLRSWPNIEAIAPYTGLVSMRHVDINSNLTRYEIPVKDILLNVHGSLADYRFNESAPDHLLLAQGEICYTTTGWYIYWSTAQTNMRQALREHGESAYGLQAREILRHFCCPSSFADIEALLELYPDHVIEFGCYAHCLGDIPNRNTVIWEVRKY